MPDDTPQQKAALRHNKAARVVRQRFPEGTRVRVPISGACGVVRRHVPGLNAQGGYLIVEWDNGHTGRIGPINVEREDAP